MYSLNKIHQQVALIHDYWFQQIQTTYAIEIAHDLREGHTTIPTEVQWHPFEINETFSGRDQYYWLRFEVPVLPLESSEYYLINVGVLRNNDNGESIPEGLVFANGAPLQAVDGNHQNIMLDHHYSDQTVTIAICFWTGLDGSKLYAEPTYTYHAIKGGKFDAVGYDCFRYLEVMTQAVMEFEDDEPLKYTYLKTLTGVLLQFDWGVMTPELFKEKTTLARQLIQTFIQRHQGEKKQFNISVIGHTHIDVAWLWRLQHTREKTARSFMTDLSLLKDYPDYIFMHSTPQVYDYIKTDYPEMYHQIKERLEEGRWEADGAAWVEPDMNIPSGESLTRQFLYGTAFFDKEFQAN